MADVSQWKKPSEIMKIHRRRKSVSQKRITSAAENRTTVIYKSPSKSVKRRNPFSLTEPVENPAKRQHIDTDKKHENSCELLNVLSKHDEPNVKVKLDKSQTHISTEEIIKTVNNISKELPSTFTEEEKKLTPQTNTEQTKTELFPYVPIDWSIKTKMRIVSRYPLQWCTQLRSTDEAQGVTSFVSQENIKVDSISEQKKCFQRCCMYWQHPNLPWIRLFPRIIDDSKLSVSGSYLLQDEVQKALQGDWEQSFTSAYHQLRSRLCPYFYLCTHQFTVMFYNQSGSPSDMVAMVTPTTRGFREALENEGIAFKLPICSKQDTQDVSRTGVKENNKPVDNTEQTDTDKRVDDIEQDDDADILETDDAASGWLESIGLDKKAFPSLDPKKVKMQREGFRVIDNRPESLVFVQGSDVQALFNFLLNCRTCTATSGPQAGVPPTILSPSPFKGATLKSHKVKHSTVKQCDKEGQITHAYILEVTGPILTSHSQALTALLYHTQSANFNMVYSNHDPTTSFNILPKVIQEQICIQCGKSSSHSKSECELTKLHTSDIDTSVINVDRFYRPVEICDRISSIKEVVCSSQGFTWNS